MYKCNIKCNISVCSYSIVVVDYKEHTLSTPFLYSSTTSSSSSLYR